LALPLFTRSFLSLSLSLSENALVEKWVFAMRVVVSIYLPRIKYAHATTTKNQTNETTKTVFEFFLKPKKNSLFLDWFSLSFDSSNASSNFSSLFALVLFHLVCANTFDSLFLLFVSAVIQKKRRDERKNREVFLLTQIIEHTHIEEEEEKRWHLFRPPSSPWRLKNEQ
jgi:hypothetical protein